MKFTEAKKWSDGGEGGGENCSVDDENFEM